MHLFTFAFNFSRNEQLFILDKFDIAKSSKSYIEPVKLVISYQKRVGINYWNSKSQGARGIPSFDCKITNRFAMIRDVNDVND